MSEDRLDRLRRSQYGYRQLSKMEYHVFPHDAPGKAVFDWKQANDASGHFEVGTISNTTVTALSYSLDLMQRSGIEKTQAYRQPLLRRLRKELPALRFEPMTSEETPSPIVAFAMADTERLAQKLARANINIAVYPHRVRISPSIYNDQGDVDRLLEYLRS